MTCAVAETNHKGLFLPFGSQTSRSQRNVRSSHNMNRLGKTFTPSLLPSVEDWFPDF